MMQLNSSKDPCLTIISISCRLVETFLSRPFALVSYCPHYFLILTSYIPLFFNADILKKKKLACKNFSRETLLS